MKWVRWVYVRLKAGSVGAWSGGYFVDNMQSKSTTEYSNAGNYPGVVLATRHARKDFKLWETKNMWKQKKNKKKKKKVEIFITKNYNVRCNAIWLKCRKVQDAGQLLIVPLSRTTQHGSYTAQHSYGGKSSAVVLGQRWGRDPSSNKHSTNPNDGW